MKKTIFLLVGFALPCLLTGCDTPYQSEGLMGGFTDTQLAPDVFRVVFRGNGYTPTERAQDFALLRASQLTLRCGFTCFAIVDERNSTTVHSATTTYTPSRAQTHISYKPETGLLIRAFQTKPDAIYTFDAAFLRKSLVDKYGLQDVVDVASPRELSTPQTSAPAQERPLLVVKGIVYSESNPSALVGKLIPPGVVGDVQSVHKGDMVAGAKITRITNDAVEFEMNGQSWRQNVER